MADFTELINRIKQLEDNVIMPITGDKNTINDLDQNNAIDFSQFTATVDLQATTQFNAPSMQTTSDLSLYLQSLTPKPNQDVYANGPQPFPPPHEVPIPFFKPAIQELVPPLSIPQSLTQVTVAPNSTPNFAEALASIEPGGIIYLTSGLYEGNYIIRQDVQIKSDGTAYFDSKISSLYIENGKVSIEGVTFRTGNVTISGIAEVQITSSVITSTLVVKGDSAASCNNTIIKSPNQYGVELQENAHLSIIQCTLEDRGIHVTGGVLNVMKTKVESIANSCAFIEGGTSYFEESYLGDCSDAVIKAINRSTVYITNSCLYDSVNSSLVVASRGSVVVLNGGALYGACKAAVVSSNGASVHVENLEIVKPIISNTNALLDIKHCKPVGVLVDNSRLLMSDCQIIAAEKSGIVSIGVSDIQAFHSIFSNCSNNGIELSERTTATIANCQFLQNQASGALIGSVSATFRDCIFDGNGIVGCMIQGSNSSPICENCQFTNNSMAGAIMLDFTNPSFINCQFRVNEKFGAIASKSNASFTNTEFSINNSVGLELKNGAAAKFNTCVFDSNGSYACQLGGQGTNGTFTSCTFNKHSSAAVVCDNKAIALFIQTFFSNNGPCHVEVRDESKGRFEQCVTDSTTGGIGLFCHNRGTIEIEKSSLKNEQKTALYVGNKGVALIYDSEILGCGTCGVFTDLQSTTIIMRNKITRNGHAGILAEGGEVKIEQNEIECHSEFGIYSTTMAQVMQGNNKFRQNAKADTQIA